MIAALALAACSTADNTDAGPTSSPARTTVGVTLPPTTGGFDYQLGGAYPPPAGVTVVERDSTTDPVPGVYSVCYVNGFQTQPGVTWPDELLVHRSDGSLLVDPGWPDEHLIDLSTSAHRRSAADRHQTTIDLCARKGFRAVEFDNLDSYTRSKGAFGVDDAIDFARMLTDRAHDAGLAVAQKNAADLVDRGRTEVGFDFAISEECDRYDECSEFASAYGDHVYDIEYTDDLRDSFSDACQRSDTPRMTILRDRDLVAPDNPAHRYDHC
ncbi:endo alpha-1,4 polygalactosaminidase [Williamsia maris]